MKPSLLFLTITTLLLLLPSPSSSSSSSDNGQLFASWCEQYDKSYSSEQEWLYRLRVFEENLAFITHHNHLGNSTYILALNAFADLTHHEFKASRLGGVLPPSSRGLGRKKPDAKPSEVLDAPPSIDWRKNGAVTDVKDQGSCAASWAFAATGAIEGVNKISTGSLVSLSEQELIDCDRSRSNDGCNGGLVNDAFLFIFTNGGIDTEEDYPFKGAESDGTCNKKRLERRVVTIDYFTSIPDKNELELLKAVSLQPVSVGIAASGKEFQFYSEGIFSGPCSSEPDHAALIVGYGTENRMDYWIVKNSWGKYWGMDGYILMLRYHSMSKGLCGINMMASRLEKYGDNPPLPPPSPPPGPTSCVIFECGLWETCCCSIEIFGVCLAWRCCDFRSAVFCQHRVHCCLHEYPVFDTGRNYCPRLMET